MELKNKRMQWVTYSGVCAMTRHNFTFQRSIGWRSHCTLDKAVKYMTRWNNGGWKKREDRRVECGVNDGNEEEKEEKEKEEKEKYGEEEKGEDLIPHF